MFNAIDLLDHNKMQIIWDLGRRCNFDCSYCTSGMHNNWSSHSSFEELIKTVEFINEYYQIYKSHHRNEWLKAAITYTGGEPTVNPNFYKLAGYIKDKYSEDFIQSLTTNGTWPVKRIPDLVDVIDNFTISYHTEGSPELKEKIKENIIHLAQYPGVNLNVNVMMHVEHWDECVDFMENFLDPFDVKFIPRLIGDSRCKPGWNLDSAGILRRTVHEYSDEQMDYIRSYWNKTNKSVNEDIDELKKPAVNQGMSLGRTCCGGRTMCIKEDNWEPTKFLPHTRFKGWKCMVNWFFLYIEQEHDKVLHHQTCRATFDETKRGPIGTLSESDLIIRNLKDRFESGQDMYITCPNEVCGCGCCVPKAAQKEDFDKLWRKYVKKDNF